ncbi:Toxin Doc [Falsiruegeria litorea R37]|uniref:Toxin Doc n=1 Tax=Falsiruegeria litorea R37 TaxID=1200284 RepID=A0A1Y5TLV0_9RHOB|nr:type II toxin-antitoxin system death-on-curing family toxin [Falsiruegeria litorea]SLN67128.1 Toxin Doc [Falsiruegeria litorea R37]
MSFSVLDRNNLETKIFDNYLHFHRQIDEIDYAGERPHLTCEDVLDAHYLICNHFYKKGEGLGGFGPKDFGLLSSAVSRQVSSAFGSFVYDDLWDIASSLIFGLINDHPFHDANKRTAFLSSVFFMMENNYVPKVDIIEVEDFTVEIAEFHHLNNRHMTIEEIAPRFKTMFRRQDKRISYVVTFNELQGLLKERDCSIGDPRHNLINVFKGNDRVAQIGFPGWSKEVSRNAISTVRKSTGLTAENGFDAQVFFKGADPLSELIGEYEEPLRRLAYR